jgi:hypothetical protein
MGPVCGRGKELVLKRAFSYSVYASSGKLGYARKLDNLQCSLFSSLKGFLGGDGHSEDN